MSAVKTGSDHLRARAGQLISQKPQGPQQPLGQICMLGSPFSHTNLFRTSSYVHNDQGNNGDEYLYDMTEDDKVKGGGGG